MCKKRLKQNKLNKMHPGGLEPPTYQLTAERIIQSRDGDGVNLDNKEYFILIKFKFTISARQDDKKTKRQESKRVRG